MPNEMNFSISTSGLSALSEMAIAPKRQLELDALLEKCSAGELAAHEERELDQLLKQIDELNLVKARAVVALKNLRAEEES
ncbi:MAG: hypothetical protein Q8M16_23600 [Pirellulaceae bacterium]|nr:hypothetical protein [Pirellulaceae bacterium]